MTSRTAECATTWYEMWHMSHRDRMSIRAERPRHCRPMVYSPYSMLGAGDDGRIHIFPVSLSRAAQSRRWAAMGRVGLTPRHMLSLRPAVPSATSLSVARRPPHPSVCSPVITGKGLLAPPPPLATLRPVRPARPVLLLTTTPWPCRWASARRWRLTTKCRRRTKVSALL
jgi:hypothetical protein